MCQPGWEEISGRMDTCICTAEFLHCSPEITTTLLTGNILVQNKKFKVGGKKSTYPHLTLFTWVKQLFYNLHAWKWSRFCGSGFICIVFFFFWSRNVFHLILETFSLGMFSMFVEVLERKHKFAFLPFVSFGKLVSIKDISTYFPTAFSYLLWLKGRDSLKIDLKWKELRIMMEL